MANITYTYRVEEVDTQSNFMLVKYSADGYPSISISMRLPFDGEETIEDVIRTFSPLNWWREQSKSKLAVSEGTTDSVTVDLETGAKEGELSGGPTPTEEGPSTL